jgi:hypothetical protein
MSVSEPVPNSTRAYGVYTVMFDGEQRFVLSTPPGLWPLDQRDDDPPVPWSCAHAIFELPVDLSPLYEENRIINPQTLGGGRSRQAVHHG